MIYNVRKKENKNSPSIWYRSHEKRQKLYFPSGLLSCSFCYQLLSFLLSSGFPLLFIPVVSVCLFPFLKVQQQPMSRGIWLSPACRSLRFLSFSTSAAQGVFSTVPFPFTVLRGGEFRSAYIIHAACTHFVYLSIIYKRWNVTGAANRVPSILTCFPCF